MNQHPTFKPGRLVTVLLSLVLLLALAGSTCLLPHAAAADSDFEIQNGGPTKYYSAMPSENTPPDDSAIYAGNHYKIYHLTMNWSEAKDYCEKLGGHLAVITSTEEQDFIDYLNAGNDSLWIGGYREEGTDFQWITGESMNYTNWADGEPNNSANVISDERCIAVWPNQWNDLNNASREQSGFICEWESGELEWSIDANGTLTIKCIGKMPDFADDIVPWYNYHEAIRTVVIEKGMTSIGDFAFCDCTSLSSITIPDSVSSIGDFAFYGCSSLPSISIPSRVTSIGLCAFQYCYNLSSITIPNGVTSISYGLFQYCSSLTRISIPNSVTSIDSFAFEGCISLMSVTIPNSVTNIGEAVFLGCCNLTNVTLSNNITSIVDWAFSYCISLTSISIPNSVASIGLGAFDGCINLRSIIIPNSVTSIGVSAFSDCISLTSITIPNSITNIGSYAFGNCSSLSNVYFYGSEAEWKALSVDSVDHAVIHYNYFPAVAWEPKTTVPMGSYMFHVASEDGRSLTGAKVTYNGTVTYTDQNGNATVSAFSYEQPVITVECLGYASWTNQDSNWKKSTTRYETIVLYQENRDALALSQALYSNSKTMQWPTVDLLMETKKVSLGNAAPLAGDFDFGNFYISCKANIPDAAAEYQLWQGSELIAESADGFFALNTDSFSKGGNCYILAVSSQSNTIRRRTDINLEFAKAPVVKETTLKLDGKSFSVKVGDDVPYLGGQTLNLKLPESTPLTIMSTENGKVQVGFNVDIKGGQSPEKQLEKAKNLCRGAKYWGTRPYGDAPKDFEKLMDAKNGSKFFGGSWMSINLLGYAEGDLGSSTASGAIILQVKIDAFSYEYNTWIYVPITVQVGLELGGSATTSITYNWETSTLDADLKLKGYGELKAFGGLGVSKFVGVGAYGKAKLEVEGEVLPDPEWEKVDLTGELGLKVYVGLLTYEKAFAYNTWHLYTGNSVGAAWLMEPGLSAGQLLASELYNASAYSAADLSYLNEEKDYMDSGEESEIMVMSADLRTRFTALIQNTYRNAQPAMVQCGDALYAAFLRADPDSGTVSTVISSYDGTNWRSSTAADASAALDDAPALLADAQGNLWLAYTRAKAGSTLNTLLGYAQSRELVVGRIDPSTLAFTVSHVYSDTGYAHLHQLSLVGGVPTLAWIGSEVSTDDDVLWPNQNTIYQAVCIGGSWSEADAVCVPEKPVTELTLGEQNGSPVYALSLDEDGSSATQDTSLYLYSGETLTKLTEGGTSVTYTTIPGTDEKAFLWVDENGVLRSTAGEIVSLDGSNREFVIAGSSVYYSRSTDTGAELCMSKFDGTSWSLPIVLTEGDGYLENICIGTLNGQDYVLGMYTHVTIDDAHVNDSKDLVFSPVQAASDLRLTDITFDADAQAAGEEVEIALSVTNAGDHTVSDVDVYVNNALYQTFAVQLAAGAETVIHLQLTCPEASEAYEIFVQESQRTDLHPEDNSSTIRLADADLSVTLSQTRIGSVTTVYAIVTNNGISPGTATLQLVDSQGNVLLNEVCRGVAAGENRIFRSVINWSAISGDGLDLIAILECDEHDFRADNDTDSLYVFKNTYHKMEPAFVLPAAVKIIEAYAFAGAPFDSVQLPEGTQSIGEGAFADCVHLQQIEIPATVTDIAEDAFDGISGLVILCPADSYAADFADAHGYRWVAE